MDRDLRIDMAMLRVAMPPHVRSVMAALCLAMPPCRSLTLNIAARRQGKAIAALFDRSMLWRY